MSERLSHTVLFYSSTNLKLPLSNYNIFDQMAYNLVNSLEYHHMTFNHILNNARAIILWGELSHNLKLIELGHNIIINELPKLITEDGFLREGSSHYQFIVTRWIFDIKTKSSAKYRSFNLENLCGSRMK